MRRGFTLVEVMVAMAVMASVSVGVYQLFYYGSSAAGKTAALGAGVDVAGSVFLQVSRHARYAERIVEPPTGGEGGTLRFSNVATGEWSLITEDGELVLVETNGLTRKVVARGVGRLVFRRPSDTHDLLEVELEVGSGKDARPFRTAVYTRGTLRIGKAGGS